MIEGIIAVFGSLVGSWVITAIWCMAGFLILALLRAIAGWITDVEEWIKRKFKKS